MSGSTLSDLYEEGLEAKALEVAGEFFDYYLQWNAQTLYRSIDPATLRSWFVEFFGPRIRHCADPVIVPDFDMARDRACFLGGMKILHEQVQSKVGAS